MPGRPLSDKKQKFPNGVRALRLQAGLTQEELAGKLGVTHSALAKLERGETRLRLDQIPKLAGVFHVDPVELTSPLSATEREILRLVRASEPELRDRMLEMLRILARTSTPAADKAA